MKDKYFISINGKQDFYADDSLISLETVGNYVKKGNFEYIIYKEYDEQNPKNQSVAVLKIDGEKCVTLIKGGKRKTRLILEKGKRHHCCYNTEIGCLMVGIFTNEIFSDFSDEGGELKINYSLDVNSSLASMNEVSVKIRRMN